MKKVMIASCALVGLAGFWWFDSNKPEPVCCTKECRVEQLHKHRELLEPSKTVFERALTTKAKLDPKDPEHLMKRIDLRIELHECSDVSLEDRTGPTACDPFDAEELKYLRLSKHLESKRMEREQTCRAAQAALTPNP